MWQNHQLSAYIIQPTLRSSAKEIIAFKFESQRENPMALLAWPSIVLITALLLEASELVRATSAALVPAVIVFGDSTADPGNNNYIHTSLKSNFLPYGRDFINHHPTGRFCNGKLATDFIAEGLGVKEAIPAYLDPNLSSQDLVTGVSFASAGTGFDDFTAKILNVIPVWKEMEYFKEYQARLKYILGEQGASKLINEAFYLISAGTNDFIENYLQFPTRRLHFTDSEYMDYLINIVTNFVKELYDLGGRRISLSGLPPMGCLPLIRAMHLHSYVPYCVEKDNEISIQYNLKLQAAIEKMTNTLPGIQIVYSDTYNVIYEAVQNPAKYGFREVARACCGSGKYELGYLCNILVPTCADASKYVFWDSVHPTEKLYKIVADNLLQLYIPKLLNQH